LRVTEPELPEPVAELIAGGCGDGLHEHGLGSDYIDDTVFEVVLGAGEHEVIEGRPLGFIPVMEQLLTEVVMGCAFRAEEWGEWQYLQSSAGVVAGVWYHEVGSHDELGRPFKGYGYLLLALFFDG